ncbi:class I SAM-dependent methyltransferase [Pseudomonas gingeri]|uniref:class I SAM-dependent methyltransferase n=1 Tax=Pseudomonas gingeri TaxID=117681 RepID=UPI0015A1563A|nr:class I SAM-dependent methyltransferase [Pseudomonas gingeri]NVZ61190.1 class I SAM-dependent methyltransferase [Pseudomonas gingeri]NVZ73743.1 class I SAM-dependent methyltransferase [Pseudomonas gingeri]
MMHCNVCLTEIEKPIYAANSNQSLTSLCELRDGQVNVWSCPACSHLRSEAFADTVAYYESDYKILLSEEEEDQIYEVRDGEIVYRTDHQITTLLSKLSLPEGATVLDYGCAKASTLKKLNSVRTDLNIHLFDVSSMYKEYWEKFVSTEKYAIHTTPQSWAASFDVLTSFFALEHIPQPIDTVRKVHALLKDGGVFYGIVPDTFGNVADFVVIDHVNHFTTPSLAYLLDAAGFTDIQIDDTVHRGALVFTARKASKKPMAFDIAETLKKSESLAHYWESVNQRISETSKANAGVTKAIYGSGFYGAYIASAMSDFDNVSCFLDASPFQQGKELFGKPILVPESLPRDVKVLYVGLNPSIAHAVINGLNWLKDRDISVVYLDEQSA